MLRPGTLPVATIVATLALLVIPAMAVDRPVPCDGRQSWFVAYGQDDDGDLANCREECDDINEQVYEDCLDDTEWWHLWEKFKCRLYYELASISCGMMAPCSEETH